MDSSRDMTGDHREWGRHFDMFSGANMITAAWGFKIDLDRSPVPDDRKLSSLENRRIAALLHTASTYSDLIGSSCPSCWPGLASDQRPHQARLECQVPAPGQRSCDRNNDQASCPKFSTVPLTQSRNLQRPRRLDSTPPICGPSISLLQLQLWASSKSL